MEYVTFHTCSDPNHGASDFQENGRINVKSMGDGELHLIVNNLSPSDTSNYTCTAINTAGRSEMNGTIIVNCKYQLLQ